MTETIDTTTTTQAEPTEIEVQAAPETEAPAEDLREPDEDEAVPAEVLAEVEARTTFDDLGLSDPIMQAVREMGYLHPTPIQAQAIPFVLMGRDVLGCAQTGTGKTASFTLPMMDILDGSRARARMPRSLILEPTRELALQVSENFVQYGKYMKLNHVLIIGGESMNDQKEALMRGVDVLIATPGRLIDLIERGGILLSDTKLLVIDEADRMLDMGFIPDVERIVGLLPKGRQTLFFSATMATPIRRLADAFLSNPKEITVSRPASVTDTITTGLAVVDELEKRETLRRLLRAEDVRNALIFCNRKRDVDILAKSLVKHGFSAGALHGDLTQSVRFATLEKFKAGELKLLVCSDVAARGLDIGGLSHVFNFDVPIHAEDYVHRIGRTGRAGLKGHAYSIASPDDRMAVDAIEVLTGLPIPRLDVDGVAPVAWSEDGGRSRGRGRGGKPASGRSGGAKAHADAKPGRHRGPKPEAAAVAVAVAEEAVGKPVVAKISPPKLVQHKPAHKRNEAPRADVVKAEPPAARLEQRAEGGRREPRRGEGDLGPRVPGFGDEVPAFMMIRRRVALPIGDEHADHG